jgi:acyl-CoA thioester hydrolase
MSTFQTQITVRVTDLNYGGHLGNVALYSYFHEARVRYFHELGINEGNVGDGISLTQIEGHVEYKGEAFLSDVLEISVFIDDFKRTRFCVKYKIVRTADAQLIGQGYAVLAAFDYETRKPQRLPSSFIEKVTAYQSQ